MEKRRYCFIDHPTKFGVECDRCGGSNIDWSEFDHMIWCYDCNVDTKGTPGIFDGPILCGTAKLMLGVSFDVVDLETGKIVSFIDRG